MRTKKAPSKNVYMLPRHIQFSVSRFEPGLRNETVVSHAPQKVKRGLPGEALLTGADGAVLSDHSA